MEQEKFDSIKAEIKQKQIAIIKEAVRLTYERLEELEKQKNKLQNDIKMLKHDLFDLKDGRLDRIIERQAVNATGDAVSVIVVAKPEKATNVVAGSPWYEEYCITLVDGESCKVNNSLTKTHASGSYKLKDGTIKYL